jgi:hypothetical protein
LASSWPKITDWIGVPPPPPTAGRPGDAGVAGGGLAGLPGLAGRHVLGRRGLGLAMLGAMRGGGFDQPGASLLAIGGFFGGVVEIHDLCP